MVDVWSLAAAATLVKLLFIPAYRSTDFEVHRNWLAITHSLPMRNWYTEETSEWTLDYPPLFAVFELLLSQVARLFDPKMLDVTNLNYCSEGTLMFQRLSVIFTDFVYFYAVAEFYKNRQLFAASNKGGKDSYSFQPGVIPALLIFNFGLFVVDHIHFQYNGILFGILLLSIIRIIEGRDLEGAFWFALLLNMKHIYMYVAPAYFVYLLRNYCFTGSGTTTRSFSIQNFIKLGSIVASVFMVSFGPFIYFNQLGQVMTRLFPFKRGLVHAYWAPNVWALYSAADKLLTTVGVKYQLLDPSSVPSASMTGGMVQTYSFVVLPDVSPALAMGATAAFMLPILYLLWNSRDPLFFLKAVVLCAFTSFLFGWHVHEKAVLLMVIPMTLLILCDRQYARTYLILSVTGNFSLFPLLFTPFENVLKVLMFLISTIFTFTSMANVYSSPSPTKSWLPSLPLLGPLESLFIVGHIPLYVFNTLGLWILGLDARLPFLPLLMTSIYCALGVTYCWATFYKSAFNSVEIVFPENEKKKQS